MTGEAMIREYRPHITVKAQRCGLKHGTRQYDEEYRDGVFHLIVEAPVDDKQSLPPKRFKLTHGRMDR